MSSMFDHDFGHLCRGIRIHMSGHSDSGILSSLERLPFFPVCTQILRQLQIHQSGRLAMTSMTFAAVNCDADEPCSMNTAPAPVLLKFLS